MRCMCSDTIFSLAEKRNTASLLVSQAVLDKNFVQRSTRKAWPSDTQTSSMASENDPLRTHWDAFKTHPEALREEESAISDYFRRLKMIQLEQETKNIFVHDTNDDTQVIYTSSQVKELEREAQAVKTQLTSRKQRVRELRNSMEAWADKLSVYTELQQDLDEAQKIASHIQDMELELARVQATNGAHMPSWSADKTKAPPLGTFTQQEADEILNVQMQEMETLEESHTNTLKSIDAAKKELATAMQTVDRLQSERTAAEKLARQASGEQRNHKLEAVCRG